MKFAACGADEAPEIRRFFIETFTDSEGQQEGQLVGELAHELLITTAAEDMCAFQARDAGQLVGCILFTRLRFQQGTDVFLLAPVAVATSCQGRGVGQGLIRFGLDQLSGQQVTQVFTYGDPGFYGRLGFQPVSAALAPPPFTLSQPEGWLALSLDGSAIGPFEGRSTCVPALSDPRYW